MMPRDLGLPLGVTWRQLWYIVGPFVTHLPGAEDSLRDLWLSGAPLPGEKERRLLLPRRFAQWWAEWSGRANAPRDAQELRLWLRQRQR